MTDQAIEHFELDRALRQCGSSWNAGQAHGFLCSQLATGGADGARAWLGVVLDGTDPDDALSAECADMLESLCSSTWRQLVERQSEFELLLPDDAAPADERAQAMAQWCEGYLHGLVAQKSDDDYRERLAAEPLADIIRDMLQITRATAGDENDEDIENAYAELVEYLRVAAQLVYEDLADLRAPAEDQLPGESDTLH